MSSQRYERGPNYDFLRDPHDVKKRNPASFWRGKRGERWAGGKSGGTNNSANIFAEIVKKGDANRLGREEETGRSDAILKAISGTYSVNFKYLQGG